jgi:hypothetical protein
MKKIIAVFAMVFMAVVSVYPQGCNPAPAGLVAWWQAEGNANDSIGGNNGTPTGGITYTDGEVGQAFDFDGTGYIPVPASPSLDVGANGSGITIECWIKPAANVNAPVIEWDSAASDGLQLWVANNNTLLFANIEDTSGNPHTISFPYIFDTNNFQHVAVTYDKGSGLAALYLNGTAVATNNFGSITPQTSYPAYQLNIGRRTGQPVGLNDTYGGLIDELSVYSRALSSSEIAAIYGAGSSGKCPSQTSSCITPPSGLVSWWQAEGNANDSIGVNNGTAIGGISYTNGEVGQGFYLNSPSAYIEVPASTSLNVGSGNGFTIEMLINPQDVSIQHPLAEWSDASGNLGIHFWISVNVGGGSGSGCLYANIVDTGNVSHQIYSSTGIVQPNVFQHVALTYDKTTGNSVLYYNGSIVATANLGNFTPMTSNDLLFGHRIATGETYPGVLDEISLYNRALGSNEIAAIYNAGSAGKCFTPVPPVITTQPTNQTVLLGGSATFSVAASGTGPLSYQWFFNGTALVASNIITTDVGNHGLGASYSGDGGAVTNAAMHTPFCVTMDGSGNLYIADSANNVIRKVNSSGIITTVAGNYSLGAGYSGDGGAATNAALNYPVCVAVDGSGNLYISDYGNAVVRKVDTNGVITTVAGNHSLGAGYSGDGGAATNAALNYPFGIVVDGSGDLYIADSQNSLIRKVNASGIITTVVGNHNLGAGYSGDGGAATNATIHAPDVVATDKSGNLYFSDFYNNVVREVNTNGIITTVAGNYNLGAGYSGDGGAATNAALNEPNGVVVDGSGNLYIADQGNNVVREVNTSGIITTVAGNHGLGAGYSGDGGAATNAAMNNPTGVDVDGSGNLYIADAVNNVIRKVTPVYNIGGNGTLTLTNVQLSQAGNYSALVSNIAGSTNSVAATLTVNVPVCTPAPSGLVSWWQAEWNAYDSIGNNNGTAIGGVSYTNGEVGQGLYLTNASAYVNVPASSGLDVGTGSGFTVELWISPNDVSIQHPLTEWGDGNLGTTLGPLLWISVSLGGGQGGPGALVANIVDTGGGSHILYSAAGIVQTNVFQHVGMTYDKTTGNAALYYNGAVVAAANLGIFTPRTSSVLLFGHRIVTGETYSGVLDEISLYNRALGSNEIAAIYNAGSAGKCFTPVAPVILTQPQSQTNAIGASANFGVAVSGTAPMSYQWSFNGTNILNATNVSLTLTNMQLNQAGNYSVLVTNIAGSTNSAAAALTVVGVPPTIATQPTNQTVQIGGTAGFNVTATGTAPLIYQWNFKGANIVGATNATLTVTNVQSSQAGNYAVSITNAYGSTVSSNAALSAVATLDHFVWNTIASPQYTNQPFGATITAKNIYNVTVTNFTGAVSLQASSAGSPTNSALILNGGFETGTLTNWSQVKSTTGQFVINSGTVVPPGAGGALAPYAGSYSALGDENGTGIFYMYQDVTIPAGVSSATLNWAHCVRNYYSSFNSGQAFQVRICDTNNNVLATAFTTSPGNTLLGGWVQTNYNVTAFAGTKVRVMFWVDSTYYYIDAYVDNVSLQLAGGLSVTPTNTGNFAGGVWNGSITVPQSATNVVLTANDGSNHTGSSNPFNVVIPTNPPVITAQPTNQTVNVGQTAVFSVIAGGSAPLNYQWKYGGTNILNATNTTLTLTNVQLTQAGSYSVTVTNIAGSTNSVSATLTVNVPVCTPAPSGLVSWWPGEGNGNDIIGANNATVPAGVTYAAGEVGQAFNFNGTTTLTVADAPSLDPTNALTIECWINVSGLDSLGKWDQHILSKDGETSARQYLLTVGSSPTAIGAGDFRASIGVPSGFVYFDSVAVVQTNTWYHLAETYDGNTLKLYVNGSLDTQMAVTGPIITTTQPVRIGGVTYRFNGMVDEPSIYSRALSASEIQAIYNAGSAGKCFTPVAPTITTQPTNQTSLVGGTATFSVAASGTAPVSYQWSLNGTNITGAINPTLTLNNVQLTQAGSYSVVVTNIAGATNSASAVLTVVLPPVITQQPTSQSVLSYSSASFTVSATGTGPLSYQWQFNGTNLVDGGNVSGSTTTNLNLSSVSLGNAGNYDVVVSNPYATTSSVVAVLTVPQTVLTLVSTNAMSGTTVVVPVLMNAVGAENAFQASVGYDPTKLVLQSVQPGPAVAGAYLQEVDTQTNNGYVGFVILLNTGSSQPAGTNEEVADLVFSTLPVTNNVTVNLTFGDNPVSRGVLDNNANSLPAIYQNGSVALAPAEYEADVYPRPAGDHQVGLQDWVEVGRMVAGLDTPTNSDEILRADCAPRNAPDGVLTVADWVQAGRYELGLDPLTLVTLPPAPSIASLAKSKPMGLPSSTRTLQIGTVSVGRGQTVSVPVLLVCTTNENAVGMTIGYDASRLKFLNATLGSAIIGGRINVNTNHGPGEVGVALAMSPGLALAAGTNQVAVLQFASMTNASGPVTLSLDGTVVKLQLADKTANVLAASYVNGAVTLPPQPVLATAITGANLQLTWQVASGTFQVESASNPTGPWITNTTSPLSFVTNGASVTVTVTATNTEQYFRLVGQ